MTMIEFLLSAIVVLLALLLLEFLRFHRQFNILGTTFLEGTKIIVGYIQVRTSIKAFEETVRNVYERYSDTTEQRKEEKNA